MKTVLVIGGATLDNIISYEDMETMVHQSKSGQRAYLLLEEGKKIEVTQQQSFSGGGATNAAVSFSLQGFKSAVFCKLGKDRAGEEIVAELRQHQIDTQHICFDEQVGTASSFVVPSLQGDRTVFAYRGANTTLQAEEMPYEVFGAVDFVYITSLSQKAAMALPKIIECAKQHNLPVAINPGNSQLHGGSHSLKDALQGIHTLILNYEEAMQFMQSLLLSSTTLRQSLESQYDRSGLQDKLLDAEMKIEDVAFSLRQFFTHVMGLGPKIVVVTDGKKGVYVGTNDQLYYHPVQAVSVVNTLGAGDAFGSSFVGGLQRGLSIENAIRSGIVNSAAVIQHPDAKTGLMQASELDQKIQAIPKQDLIVKAW